MVENRGKVVPLQPSPRHTGTFSHSFSVSSFACFPAPTGYNTSSTSPATRQEAFCACTGIVYASLDNAAGRDTIRETTARSVFRWVNGPRAPGETTGCWEKSQEGDGEFIVASWIPLLPIRFREAGSRMRKEATGCLSVQRVSKRGIFRGNGSTKRAELCLLNFYFTRKKTMGATDPCPDQFPTIFKIQLAIAIDEKSPGSRIISRAREKFLEARNLESRSEEMEMVNRTRGL